MKRVVLLFARGQLASSLAEHAMFRALAFGRPVVFRLLHSTVISHIVSPV